MTASVSVSVVTTDGVRIRYWRYGGTSLSSPRILLIHPLALNASVWEDVISELPQSLKASVLTLDCRGHGVSETPDGPYSLGRFAADAVSVMDQEGWPSAIVAGASMGGNVAQALAIDYPDRVTGLGLIDTTAWYGPDAKARWAERADRARSRGLSDLVEFQLSRWFSDEFRIRSPEVGARYAKVFVENDVNAYAETCQMLGSFDLRDAITSIEVPTAVVVGENDYATPVEMAQAIVNAIPKASLSVLPGARHLTPLERPVEVAGTIVSVAELAAHV